MFYLGKLQVGGGEWPPCPPGAAPYNYITHQSPPSSIFPIRALRSMLISYRQGVQGWTLTSQRVKSEVRISNFLTSRTSPGFKLT